ncbi:alpha/beta fold hydrolase [Nocardia sp. NPDC087230]|uniref:alpha/beta fold hydrolase n=1 Tax=Nocardia sp. NPDC087230 TaxID=3364331 RepID=UPI00381515A1
MTESRTNATPFTRARDRNRFTVTTDDDTPLVLTRYGRRDAAATVIYLHGPLADATSWTPLISEIHQHFGGEIAQLVYDQRGHRHGVPFHPDRPGVEQLVADLDTVIAHASGRVILVAESFAAILLQEWLFRHRRGVLRLDAVVAICPVPALPGDRRSVRSGLADLVRQPGSSLERDLGIAFGILDCDNDLPILESVGALMDALRAGVSDVAVVEDMLRATPTWIVAGKQDRLVGHQLVAELADTVWAEWVLVDDAGHDLIATHTRIAADAVVAALEAAHEQTLFRGA